jgi:hypothetical protein
MYNVKIDSTVYERVFNKISHKSTIIFLQIGKIQRLLTNIGRTKSA